MRQRILLVEEEAASRQNIATTLAHKGYAVDLADDQAGPEEQFLARRYDAVLVGISHAGGKGSAFIKGVREYDPYLPVIVLTGSDQVEVAVEAVRLGADNVLAKPVDFAALCASLSFLLEEGSLKPAPGAGRNRHQEGKESFFGTGPIAGTFAQLSAEAAAGDQPVLITGETGTGKGMLAQWLHDHSSRAGLAFVGVNCSGLREELLEEEIFGAGLSHRRGVLDQVGGGTLFLDEIGDMDLRVQERLLGLLKTRGAQVSPGGSAGAGFRLISSSNQQLENLARSGAFLPELLKRIGARVLSIPPLRERVGELPGIVRQLLDQLRPGTEITGEAMRALKGYRWPGNLRELKNALELALMLSHGGRLRPEHFAWLKPSYRVRDTRPLLTMSELKEQHIEEVLQKASGDVNQAAASLGLSRATIYRRLKVLRGRSL